MEERKVEQQEIMYTPIEFLRQISNWIIKVRVIKKSSLKDYNGKDGKKGKYFSIEIMDKDQNKINGVFFNEAATKFNNQIQIGKVYSFEKGQTKFKQKKYGNSDGLALQFCEKSTILPILEENSTDIPTINIEFTSFDKLETLDEGAEVNIIGIIVSDSLLQKTKNSEGKTIDKRVVELFDQHLKQIEVTFWEQNAREYQYPMHSVLAIQGGKLKTFLAIRQIDIGFISSIFHNGQGLSQTKALKEWFLDAKEKGLLPNYFPPITNKQSKSIMEHEQLCLKKMMEYSKMIKDSKMVEGSKVSIWNKRTCRISAIAQKNAPFYTSCPAERCWKKVKYNEEKKEYVCAKCQKSFERSKIRFLTRVKIEEDSKFLWCFISHDQCQKLFGIEATDYKKLVEINTPESKQKLQDIFEIIKKSEYNLSIESKIDVIKEKPEVMHCLNNISDPIAIENLDAADLNFDQEDSDDIIENEDIFQNYEVYGI